MAVESQTPGTELLGEVLGEVMSFLRKMPNDTAIVGSHKLSEMQISYAKAEDRFFVDPVTQLGYAIVSIESLTSK